jgi:hypothetical protein
MASKKTLAMSKLIACPLAKTNSPAIDKVLCPLGSAMFSEQAWGEIARSLKLSGRELQIVRGVFDDQLNSPSPRTSTFRRTPFIRIANACITSSQ